MLVYLVAVCALCGILAAVIERNRGGNVPRAFIAGLLLGPLGLLLVVITKPAEPVRWD